MRITMNRPIYWAACLGLVMGSFACSNPQIQAKEALAIKLEARATAQRESLSLYERSKTSFDAGDFDKARKNLLESLEVDDRNVKSWMLLGLIEFNNDKLYEASSAFRQASRLQPMRHEPVYNLGATMERAGKYDRAIEYYEAAMKLAPDSIRVKENMARCYVKLGKDPGQVRKLLEQVQPNEHRPEWRAWMKNVLSDHQEDLRPF